jgi:hypothetical protein
MAFCSSCGTQVADGVKFCTSCGKPIGGEAAAVVEMAPSAKPRSVTVGQVKKCPACGAEIESFQVRCPSCGHEISGIQVSESVKDFSTQLENIENERLSKTNKPQKPNHLMWIVFILCILGGSVFIFINDAFYELGHSFHRFSSGTIGIIGLISELIDTFGFTVLLYAVAAILMIVKKPTWTERDERKQAFIENYPVPNTRELITEFLIFSQSKIEKIPRFSSLFLNAGKYKKAWNTVWIKKIKQMYNKAQISMAVSDPQSFKAIDDIVDKSLITEDKNKKRNLIKCGIAAAAVLVILAVVSSISSSGVLIKVPKSKTYELSAITTTGKLTDYFKVIGENVTIESADDGTDAAIIITLEKTKAIGTLIDEGIDVALKSKGWAKKDCTVTVVYESLIGISRVNGILASGYYSGKAEHANVIKSLIDMDIATSKRLTIPVVFKYDVKTSLTKKKAVKSLMDLNSLQINFSFRSRVVNNSIKTEKLSEKTEDVAF